MEVPCLKIINTSRGFIRQYQNLKRKLYNCNANIYCNQNAFKKHKPQICQNQYSKHLPSLKIYTAKIQICVWTVNLNSSLFTCAFKHNGDVLFEIYKKSCLTSILIWTERLLLNL